KLSYCLVLLLPFLSGCGKKKENMSETKTPQVFADSGAIGPKPLPAGTPPALSAGLYAGGLKVAVSGHTVNGFYESSSGWDESVQAPRFHCAYTFQGDLNGTDSIPIFLQGGDAAHGYLKVLSPQKIHVYLSFNACENEQPTHETWTLEKAYPLLGLKQVVS